METKVPVQAPWDLTGSGYIMMFKFPKAFILDHGFVGEHFREGLYGNVSTIVFADYLTSNVGPYQDLFFLPGKIHYQHHKFFTVSKNFTSSPASVKDSIANWGITKETASFSVVHEEEGLDTLKVTYQGVPVIDISIKPSRSKLSFPLRTFFQPVPLMQYHDGRTFRFNIHGKGSGKLAQIFKVDINPELFPNFAFFKHIAIIRVSDFNLKIPAAKVKGESED